jgi:hypothetical protein
MAKVLTADPALSSTALATANSAAYRRSAREVADVKAAISRLGFNTVRAMATAKVVRGLEESAPTPEAQRMTIQLWEHVARVAALSKVIARRVTGQDPEEAIFAGIVHESGSFFLLVMGGGWPGLLSGPRGSLVGWAGAAEARIGRAILGKMGVPEITSTAIAGVWEDRLATPPMSLADTLVLAHRLAPPSPLDVLTGVVRDTESGLARDLVAQLLVEAAPEAEHLAAAIR